MLQYEIQTLSYVALDLYEGEEVLGRYDSMEQAVNAACQRYHDTDGECNVEICRVSREIIHGWYYPVCPDRWSYVKRKRDGDFCLIGTADSKEEAQAMLNAYIGDNCFKPRNLFFLCGPDCTLYDAEGKEVKLNG